MSERSQNSIDPLLADSRGLFFGSSCHYTGEHEKKRSWKHGCKRKYTE